MVDSDTKVDSDVRLSIVMPIYNEEKTLREITERVFSSCGDIAEVIFVDDGSKDSSQEIARSLARSQDSVFVKENGGKGSAVRLGYTHANGRYVIVQDADLEYDPEEIPGLLEYAEKNNVEALYGSHRLKKQRQFVHLAFFLGGTILTHYCDLLYRTKLTDQPTCYKMVRIDILQSFQLRESDFRFDPELTSILARKGVFIDEQPISYHPRSLEEGKKINWKDGFKWLWVFTKLRLMSRKKLERLYISA